MLRRSLCVRDRLYSWIVFTDVPENVSIRFGMKAIEYPNA